MKLPPYAKQLREQRDRGDHPWAVSVYFTRQWHRPLVGHPPVIMVPIDDYHPGEYDWTMVSGVAVDLFVDLSSTSPYLRLGMEIAQFAAPVFINFVQTGLSLKQRELDSLLWCERSVDKATGRMAWPAGWSDDINQSYQQRADKLLAFYLQAEDVHTQGMTK